MAVLNEARELELEPEFRTAPGGGSADQPVEPVDKTMVQPTVETEPVGTTQPVVGTTSETPAEIDMGAFTEPLGGSEDPGAGDADVSVQELYPEMPELGSMDEIDVPDAAGASVTEADAGVTEMDTAQATTDTGNIIEGAVGEVSDTAGPASSELTAEQQVDAELARILGQDSPLLAQARAEAARMANQRGLMNSSMAAGMTYDALVRNAMPMAQQNAQQAFQRELENARMRQESGMFTAEQISRLRSLEAELGQELSIFNADQLNQAEQLAAELRTAIEQGNAQAYNEAAIQLAELQRDAEAQQAEIDYAAAEREFLERQAYNEQIIDAVTELNRQYMSGEQLIDIEHVRGTYQQIISTNETAATLFDSYLRSIGQIFDDPKMSTSQAGEAIQSMLSMLQASLGMIAEMNDMDFGELSLSGGGGGGGGDGGGGGSWFDLIKEQVF